jgi:hypothetical protein
MRHDYYNILIAYSAFALLLASCKPPAAAAPSPSTADTLVVVDGGWGEDQTGKMAAAIRAQCPRARVISVGSWDAYKVDIRPIIAANPLPKRVYILHSYAAWWLTQTLPHADYEVILDGVNPGGSGQTWYGDLPLPANVDHVELYWRTDLIGPRDARIPGTTPIIVPGAHNDVPNNEGVIAATIAEINALEP